jgi:hypothetical protein
MTTPTRNFPRALLAAAVGVGDRTRRAHLSTSVANAKPAAVSARDRIGNRRWVNARGVVMAKNRDELRRAGDLTRQTALRDKGQIVRGRGDSPNDHDILTASQPDGGAPWTRQGYYPRQLDQARRRLGDRRTP